ncbi:MAG: hypothetical protein MK291_11155, partial [Planctomycetes bacterium]|nr:hypothetical protein [Planctomycetota bacterium]
TGATGGLGIETARALASGYMHSCTLLSGGELHCWGRNYSGSLGLGSSEIIGDDEDDVRPPVDISLHRRAETTRERRREERRESETEV